MILTLKKVKFENQTRNETIERGETWALIKERIDNLNSIANAINSLTPILDYKFDSNLKDVAINKLKELIAII